MIASALLFHDLASSAMVAFFLAGGLLLLVGVADDLWDLSWKYRIGAQVVACRWVMIYLGGVSVQQLSDVVGVHDLDLGWSQSGDDLRRGRMINALNMSDGVDGLAGGQALVSLLLFLCSPFMRAMPWTAEGCWRCRPRYWVSSAGMFAPRIAASQVFLGDAGSMLLGFVIAWTAVRLTRTRRIRFRRCLDPGPSLLPLIDCCSIILRRWKQGRSPFALTGIICITYSSTPATPRPRSPWVQWSCRQFWDCRRPCGQARDLPASARVDLLSS